MIPVRNISQGSIFYSRVERLIDAARLQFAQRLFQFRDRIVALIGIYMGTDFDDAGDGTAGSQLLRMAAGKHEIQQDTKSVNIRSGIRLTKTVLLRCRVVDGAKKNRIALFLFTVGFGCVKIDQDRTHICGQDHV